MLKDIWPDLIDYYQGSMDRFAKLLICDILADVTDRFRRILFAFQLLGSE